MYFSTIGRGVYTLTEASLLTGVNRHRISRWAQGYTFMYHGKRQTMPAIIGREPDSAASPILTFADLIEIRFLEAFHQKGVSTKALRIASQRAKELLGRHHPFSTQRKKKGSERKRRKKKGSSPLLAQLPTLCA